MRTCWYVRYESVGVQPNGKVGPLDLYGKTLEEYFDGYNKKYAEWFGRTYTD